MGHTFVYKIKKPVRFSFADYSTLKLRYHYCQEEVRLNTRLTPRVYLGVFPIFRHGPGYALGAQPVSQFAEDAVEYAVKMRRRPEDRILETLVQQNQINAENMHEIALTLAAFHKSAAAERSWLYGSSEAVEQNISGNLDECRPFVGDTTAQLQFEAINPFNQRCLKANKELLDRRAHDGMVREGHGDLHTEHICITEHIDMFDCVEFNERLRYGDIASDLAFLLMDIDRLGALTLGHELLAAYIAAVHDPDLTKLLNFYKFYRAIVRANVSSFKAREPEISGEERKAARQKAREYFQSAFRYAKVGSPALIIVCGLSGTGKSTIAKRLAERLGCEVFSSDVVRKKLFDRSPDVEPSANYGAGIYHPELTQMTYDALLCQVRAMLASGRGVIVDATLKDADQRLHFLDLARAAAVPVLFVECVAPEALVSSRLAARPSQPDNVSDATGKFTCARKKSSRH